MRRFAHLTRQAFVFCSAVNTTPISINQIDECCTQFYVTGRNGAVAEGIMLKNSAIPNLSNE